MTPQERTRRHRRDRTLAIIAAALLLANIALLVSTFPTWWPVLVHLFR